MSPETPTIPGAPYREPPRPLVDVIDAPATPAIVLHPSLRLLLALQPEAHPSISELATPELRLGGLRIHPVRSGPSRIHPHVAIEVLQVADGSARPVTGLPSRPRIEGVTLSPGGTRIAFTHTGDERIELWVADLEEARARRVADVALNLAGHVGPRWLDDGHLVAALVPDGRGAPPPPPRVPSGPVVQETSGRKAAARTFQDLLQSPHDETLFEHYLSAQVAVVGLDGSVAPIGPACLVWDLEPSPDGRYVLVHALHRPFSYLVPASRFPVAIEVWDRSGRRVRTIADLPLREEIPITFGSVAEGPREAAWRADVPATLHWAEALDGGDAGREAAERDRLLLLEAPFEGAPRPWATLALRLGGVTWGHGELALVDEWWWKSRQIRTHVLAPDVPERASTVLFDRSWEDRYGDPGTPLTTRNALGRRVLACPDARTIYLAGAGASPDGDRPFLDLMDLGSRETRRLFRSEAPWFEQPVFPLSPTSLLVRRESPDVPPNLYVRDLTSGDLRPVTRFPHPTPQLQGVRKELVRYTRSDGVALSGTLYLPAGHRPEDGPLPLLMWAYPEDYKSAANAGQVKDSPYRFNRVGWWSPLVWLTQGYAVLDDPSIAIVGEGEEEPNDSYVSQLVASATAAVEEVVRRGVADRHRIAVGGHSYGAFMTANLLAHTDLFAAGIAQSGAYNRTLTPFGFQSEERSLWQAPAAYQVMSPLNHADRITRPLLLVHGAADNNSGTFSMQSERLFNAIKGLGGVARLVMLPHESHAYEARESLLHLMWEVHRWLELHVKGAPRP